MIVITLAVKVQFKNGRFYAKDSLSVWTNLGKHLLFVWFCVSSIKTGTIRIMRLDKLSFEIRLERRTMKGTSSGRIMRLVPVFILETHNQTNYKMFAQVRPDLSIKTANYSHRVRSEIPASDWLEHKFWPIRSRDFKYFPKI